MVGLGEVSLPPPQAREHKRMSAMSGEAADRGETPGEGTRDAVGGPGWVGWGSEVTGGHSQNPSAGVSIGSRTHRCSGIFVSWLLLAGGIANLHQTEISFLPSLSPAQLCS